MIGWLMDGWGIRLHSNRAVLCIKFTVSSRICLFTESGNLYYHTITAVTEIHLQDTYPIGRRHAKIPARRSRLCTSMQGQSNIKCSVSSMPSFVGHIGLVVSLKFWLNL